MITVRDLSKSYGDVRALDQVSFEAAPGETIAISGPSGSGKTTLLRLIAGLERPDHGLVELDGEPASTPANLLAPHRRGIGFVFQEPALWPHMTVAQNIAFPILDWPRTERRARVDEILSAMRLDNLAGRHPSAISGGEARRVALGRALSSKPPRLLLDEPIVNLEPQLRAHSLDEVLQAAAELGSTVLMVTHDPIEAERFSRIVRLDQGRIMDP